MKNENTSRNKQIKDYRNRKDYLMKYNKANYYNLTLKLNKENDKDIIDFLNTVNNKNAALRNVIRLGIKQLDSYDY